MSEMKEVRVYGHEPQLKLGAGEMEGVVSREMWLWPQEDDALLQKIDRDFPLFVHHHLALSIMATEKFDPEKAENLEEVLKHAGLIYGIPFI